MRLCSRSKLVLACSALGVTFSLAACGGDDTAADAAADGGMMKSQTPKNDANAPTWYKDIAPIVSDKCTGCHTEGGIAPFSMKSYESAKDFAGSMAQAVEDGRMPPFLAQETDACKPRLPWANDIRLSADQKKTIRAWANAGAPEGDKAHPGKLGTPAPTKLAREDVVLTVPEKITVDGKQDIHTCMVLDPKLKEDGYVIGRQITAGNNAVLHHVVSYLVTPQTKADGTMQTRAEMLAALKKEKNVAPGGRYDCFGGPSLTTVGFEMLDAWAPGGVPSMAPPDSGQPISKDALVLLDTHYHPTGNGAETDDSTHLGLMLATSKPKLVSRVILLGNFEGTNDTNFGTSTLLKQPGESKAEFMIPAGEAKHVEEMTWTWKLGKTALRVYAMGTHMHYVGQDMRVTLEHAAGARKQECLIETPVWDFNWQRGYAYDAAYADLPEMLDGDTVRMRCVFNNTTDNAHVLKALDDRGLDAPVDVPLGEDTLDEMCLAAVGIVYPNPN